MRDDDEHWRLGCMVLCIACAMVGCGDDDTDTDGDIDSGAVVDERCADEWLAGTHRWRIEWDVPESFDDPEVSTFEVDPSAETDNTILCSVGSSGGVETVDCERPVIGTTTYDPPALTMVLSGEGNTVTFTGGAAAGSCTSIEGTVDLDGSPGTFTGEWQ
jgi:hypothetical protein